MSTGKTLWLTNDIKDRLEKGIRPNEICAVTFTRVAAAEIRRRLIQKFPEYRNDDFPWVGTIHSICCRLLQVKHEHIFMGKMQQDFMKAHPQYQYSADPQYEYEDEGDMDFEVHEQMLSTLGDYFEHFDSRQRNAMISFEDQLKFFLAERDYDIPLQWTKETQLQYTERKQRFLQEHRFFDFNSLLETVVALRASPRVRYLYCDEAQDNSPLMWAVLKVWAEGAQRFTCLGDPDQCVYDPFLPADLPQFISFINQSARVTLSQSHRLPRSVHKVSEEWISTNLYRMDRLFLPRSFEGSAQDFMVRDNLDWEDFAVQQPGEKGRWKTFVLSRTRWQSRFMKNWMYHQGIPFASNRGKANPMQAGRGRLAYGLMSISEGKTAPAHNFLSMKRWVSARPWTMHGGKTQFLRYIEAQPDREISADHLLANGFSPAFMDCLTQKGFLEPLKITDWDKAYMMRCYNRFGRDVFAKPPCMLVTNTHGVKGAEADFVVVDPSLRGHPARALARRDEVERRIAYVAITRARRRLYVLMPTTASYYDFKIRQKTGDKWEEEMF